MEKLEKVKQGKIDPNELLKSLSKETPQNIGIISSDAIKNNSSVNEHSRVASHKPGISVSKENRRHEKTEPSHKRNDDEIKK